MIFIILLSQNYKVLAADSHQLQEEKALQPGYGSKESQERLLQEHKKLLISQYRMEERSNSELLEILESDGLEYEENQKRYNEILSTAFGQDGVPFIFNLVMAASESEVTAFLQKRARRNKYSYYIKLEKFLEEFPNFDFRVTEPRKYTALHIVTDKGSPKVLKLLTQRQPGTDKFKFNIDVNQLNIKGETPLITALTVSKETRNSRVKDLIKVLFAIPELDLNIKNQYGYTAFHHATIYPTVDIDIFKLFLNNEKVDKATQDNDGMTPLMHLLQDFPRNQDKLALLLPLSRPEDFTDFIDENKYNGVGIAAQNQYMTIEYLEEIIQKSGINILEYRVDDMPLLHLASFKGDLPKIKFFKEKGLSLTYHHAEQKVSTPLLIYMQEIFAQEIVAEDRLDRVFIELPTIEALLGEKDLGVVNITDFINQNPLHLLMKFKKVDYRIKQKCLDLFLNHEVDVNGQSRNSDYHLYTPLMIAITNRDFLSVKKLLPLSNLRLINTEGNTCLMLAAKFYDEKIYNLIFSEFKNLPYMLEVENNNGQTYQELIPDHIKKGKALIREEELEKRKAIILRNVELAKQISEIEKQEELEKEQLLIELSKNR